MASRCFWLCLAGLLAAAGAPAQADPRAPHLWLGWGVDTTQAPVREIAAALRAYLTAEPAAARDSSLWCAGDRAARTTYDLTAAWLYQGFDATLLEISPSLPDSSEYVVKTLFAGVDEGAARPIGLQRLQALREGGRWVLCGWLSRHTAEWAQATLGRIIFHFAPDWRFDTGRARRAAAFVDSVAALLELAPPAAIDYYVADSPEAMLRMLGLDWYVPGIVARAYAPDRLVVCGDPVQREAYVHELVHVLMWPPASGRGWPQVVAEGVPSWLGGSRGKDFAALMAELVAFQEEHPEVRIADVLAGGEAGMPVRNQTGALIASGLYRRGGAAAVKRLLEQGSTGDAVLARLRAELGLDDAALDEWWRAEARQGLDRK